MQHMIHRYGSLSLSLSLLPAHRAKIFYPGQSQVNDSAQDQAPPNKKRKTAQSDVSSGNLVNSTEESSMTSVANSLLPHSTHVEN